MATTISAQALEQATEDLPLIGHLFSCDWNGAQVERPLLVDCLRAAGFAACAPPEISYQVSLGRALRGWITERAASGAVRAPRDPEWVADGQVSAHWLPVSPVTGKLGAFEWKQAYGPAQSAIEDHSNHAEEAFRTLPAPAPTPAREAEPEPVARTFVTEPAVEQIVVAAAEAAEPAKPTERAKPELVVVDEAAPKAKEEAAPDPPFFGRPPEDPGVKPIKAAAAGKQGFKLF